MTDSEQAATVERVLGGFAICYYCLREMPTDKMHLVLGDRKWSCSEIDMDNWRICASIGWDLAVESHD